jgi:hypothetical protein
MTDQGVSVHVLEAASEERRMLLLFRHQHSQRFLLEGATPLSLQQQMNPISALTQLESLKRPHEGIASVLGKIRWRVPVDTSFDRRVSGTVRREVVHPPLEHVVANRNGYGGRHRASLAGLIASSLRSMRSRLAWAEGQCKTDRFRAVRSKPAID